MFTVIIVEDEKPILNLMEHVIGQNPKFSIKGAFTSPLEALARLPELRPDVAFLDVEMPKMNGLELAQKINDMSDQTIIIFTTAHAQYALDAFRVHAFDYILKPVTPKEIERITKRLVKQQRVAAPVKERMQHARIRCFGGFEVRNREGDIVRFPTRKTEELFAYFLCHPEQDISKWRLADLLWPDMETERVSHNLHNTMYRLKKLLKEHHLGMEIQKTSEGYMLDTSGLMYDVLAFLRYDLFFGEGSGDVEQAEQLCALYKGSLLERKGYLWKATLEEGYFKQYTMLVDRLTKHDLAKREWTRAEQRLDAYLSLYPLQEEMNLALMKVFAARGNKEKIARHYVRFEAAYHQELGMELPGKIRSWVRANLDKGE